MNNATAITYSSFASHNRDLKKADFDTSWGWLISAEAEVRRVTKRWPNGHRVVSCAKAWLKGIKIRLRELDREVDAEMNWCKTVGI